MDAKKREKIIKGLEDCATLSGCGECPFVKEDNCGWVLGRDALALVKELTEENERLRAEKEKLHVSCTELTQCCTKLETLYKIESKRVDTTKADTVRKMQERFKMYFGTYCLGYKIPLSEALKAVNQIAKEMLD